MTALAAVVFLVSKFLEGAWAVVLAVPLLMLLFARIQRYYTAVGVELGLGLIPEPPERRATASWSAFCRIGSRCEARADR